MNDEDIRTLTQEQLLLPETYTQVYDIGNTIERQAVLTKMRLRAKELKLTKEFDDFVKAFERLAKQMEKARREVEKEEPQVLKEHYTNFDSIDYPEMKCGPWIAHEGGIYIEDPRFGKVSACAHPIIPVERMRNVETGEEFVVIAFKRRGRWEQMKVKKGVIASAQKIIQLADYGVAVNSENARNLVRYLSDVDTLNDNDIKVSKSTSKLGWHGDEFMPYTDGLLFDGDARFKNLFNSITERGNLEAWLDHVRLIRGTGRHEPRIMLAASFASALIPLTGQLPFFVDLYGETEGGKTVTLMLAASIWANPAESQYIGDFKSTDVALEARADVLNNLPMILDDTSKTSQRIQMNFESVVYDLCSGKGKSRSNKALGLNRENHWSCCFLTNGERPLASYVSQGGAINRIIEVECLRDVFENPAETAELLKLNYGFAGKRFIEIVLEHRDEIPGIFNQYRDQLSGDNVMQKQVDAVAVILTADQLATEYLFQDGNDLRVDDVRDLLTDYSEVSDNERCYEYLIDKVRMNSARFDKDSNIEQWGIMKEGCAVFFNAAFNALCRSEGYSRKTFLAWALRSGKIEGDSLGNPTKVAKDQDGKSFRGVWLIIPEEGDGFMDVEDEDVPFI